MEVLQLGNQWRLWLTPREYQLILENAPDRVSKIVMRLCGECCLRYSEALEAKLAQVEESQYPSADSLFFKIPHKDGQVPRLGQNNGRRTVLPKDLFELMKRHAEEEDLSYQDDLVQYCTRTIYNRVTTAGERTAEQTGREEFLKLSPQDFRASFVRNAIERFRMNPQVVLQIGGWKRFDSMAEELSDPDERDMIQEYGRVEMDNK